MHAVCPSPETLQGLLQGKLSDEMLEEISAHLQQCQACLDSLDQLGGTSSVLGAPLDSTLVAGVRPPTGFVQRVMALARAEEDTVSMMGGAATWPASAEARRAGRLFGDYELLEEIGGGGMGTIYMARQRSANRIVALKMIRLDKHAKPAYIRRFRVEAEAAARLDHPGIVPVYEVGEQEGQHFFSMGFIAGQSLAARLAAGPLPPREAAQLLSAVAEAVQYAHERGVVHRDLKPANILLEGKDEGRRQKEEEQKDADNRQSHSSLIPPTSSLSSRPRITDFGLAKLLDADLEMTKEGDLLGTPSYMAPEQAAGDLGAIGPAADIYALGATLYAALTGRPPFQAAEPLEILAQVKHQDPVPPRQLTPSVPRDLETIALKCLEKDPARRYATAGDVAQELRRYLADEPILARPIGRAARAFRWCRRKPVVAALAALATVFVGVLAIGGPIVAIREGNLRQYAQDKENDAIKQLNLADSAAQEAMLNQYTSDMRLSQFAVSRDNFTAAFAPHDRHREPRLRNSKGEVFDPRGWEWHYQDKLLHQELQSWEESDRPVRDACCNPEDSLMACIIPYARPATGRIVIRELATGAIRQTWEVEPWLASPRFSPDGKRLAVAVGDGIRVWDVESGDEVFRVKELGDITSLCYSPDGGQIAVGGNVLIRVAILNAATGERTHTLEGGAGSVQKISYSPDGAWLAVSRASPDFEIYRAGDFQLTHAISTQAPFSSEATFSTDSKRVYASLPGKGSIGIWDVATGQKLDEFALGAGGVGRLAVSSNSRFIAGALREAIRLWDLAERREVRTYLGHHDEINGVSFTNDGTRLLSSSADGMVKLWDVSRGEASYSVPTPSRGGSHACFLADGKHFAAIDAFGREGIQIWRVDTREVVNAFPVPGNQPSLGSHIGARVACSPDGKWLAAVLPPFPVQVWNLATATVQTEFDGGSQGADALVFSPNSARLAVVNQTPQVSIIDIGDGHCSTLQPQLGRIRAGAFDPNNRWLAVATDAQQLARIDISTNEPVWNTSANVNCVKVSPDGTHLATGSRDKIIRIWDASSGEFLRTLQGHQATVTGIAYNRDGSRLATASWDGTIRIWNPATGEELVALPGTEIQWHGVEFSPKDDDLLAWGRDESVFANGNGTIQVWCASARNNQPQSQRFAEAIVRAMRELSSAKQEVLRKITEIRGIPSDVRPLAIQAASELRDQPFALPFQETKWEKTELSQP